MWNRSFALSCTLWIAALSGALGARPAAAELVDTERGSSVSVTQFETEKSPVTGRSFVDLALLTPGVTRNNSRQSFDCAGYATAGGRPVKGFAARVTFVGVRATGEVTDLASFKLRSSAYGVFSGSPIDVTGYDFPAYGAYVITTGRKKADTVAFRCTHSDYDLCAADVCFGPNNRFAINRLPVGWFKNSANEIENGTNQRWQVSISDQCRKGGFQITARPTLGNARYLEDVGLLDTMTGQEFPGPGLFMGDVALEGDVGFKFGSWCGLP